MKLIQRANKQLRIPDDRLEEYIEQGYKEVTFPTEFVCPVCGKKYKTEANLKNHMEKEHPSGGDS